MSAIQDTDIKCKICGKSIDEYRSELNCVPLSDKDSVIICQTCIDKIVKWQSSVIAKLFPTKKIKRLLGENKKNIK